MISAAWAGININLQDDVLVNLTNMWRAWQQEEPNAGVIRSHRPVKFLELPTARKFLSHLEKSLMVRKSDLLKSTMGKNGGTWAHWKIALAYAEYLSPAFHSWMLDVVKQRFAEIVDPVKGVKSSRERAIKDLRSFS